jgi:hypothetical protein
MSIGRDLAVGRNATVTGTFGVTGAAIFSSTLTGPAAAIFYIDNGGANAINIGGTTATTLNLGRTGQIQALLGDGTVAGTLGITGLTTVTGGISGPAAAALAIDAGGAQVINIGATNGTTLNLGRNGQTQALVGNGTVAGTLKVAGNLTIAPNTAYTSTFTATSGNYNTPGTVTAATFSGAGTGITSLPDGALSGNVPLINTSNAFTGTNNFSIEYDTFTAGAAGVLVTLTCPSGKYALNGGCSCTGGVAVTDIINRPDPEIAGVMPTGWACQLAGATGGVCSARVTCSKIKF